MNDILTIEQQQKSGFDKGNFMEKSGPKNSDSLHIIYFSSLYLQYGLEEEQVWTDLW